METLSYGYKKPENGDTGDVILPSYQENVQKMNDHTHDGQNSARVQQTRQQLTAGSWQSFPVPLQPYYAELNMPDGMTFDNTVIIFTDFVNGSVVPLDVVKTGDTTFTVYSNNPTDYWILFL